MRISPPIVVLTGCALALAIASWASGQPSVTSVNVVTNVWHDATTGATMVGYASGAVVNDGISNGRGNNVIQTVGTSGTAVMACGTHIAKIEGAAPVTALTIVLPSCPETNDTARIMSAVAVAGLTIEDALGNTVLSNASMAAWQQIAMDYEAGAWVQLLAPAVDPVQSVSGLTGAITSGALQTALGLGTAAYQSASAFYAASNPSGFITSTAAASTYLTQSAAAAAYYPLSSNPSSFLTTSLAAATYYSASNPPPCPAATNTTLGCIKSNAALISTVKNVSATLPGVAAVFGLIATPVTVSGITGEMPGDILACSFSGTPPTNFSIVNCNPTGTAGSAQVTFSTTSLLTVGSQAISLNFTVTR